MRSHPLSVQRRSAPAGEWKAAVGKRPPANGMQNPQLCVCVSVDAPRGNFDVRKHSTMKVRTTKGFPISFNGALIATPTEGMEQPDEKGWREGLGTWGGGEKRTRGGRFDAITRARSGFQLTTGRPIVCEVSTEYRLSILLHRAAGLCNLSLSLERYEVALNRRASAASF